VKIVIKNRNSGAFFDIFLESGFLVKILLGDWICCFALYPAGCGVLGGYATVRSL